MAHWDAGITKPKCFVEGSLSLNYVGSRKSSMFNELKNTPGYLGVDIRGAIFVAYRKSSRRCVVYPSSFRNRSMNFPRACRASEKWPT
jgi:hypothetical protein